MLTRLRKSAARMFAAQPTVTVIRLTGAIGASGRFSRALNDASMADQIERAFKPKKLKAVALSINCPGGSPVQSSLLYARIRAQAAERGVPVLAFCEDVAASGGYYLACAADEIFVDESTIIGSIGVIHASFGFSEALGKLGVERRIHTAGAQKAKLDPFLAEKPEDVVWLKKLQQGMHESFISVVKNARGDRLAKAADTDLFTGDVWLGREAVALGLADHVGHLNTIIKQRFGKKVSIEVVSPKRGFFDRIGPEAISSNAVEAVAKELETRALWARSGV